MKIIMNVVSSFAHTNLGWILQGLSCRQLLNEVVHCLLNKVASNNWNISKFEISEGILKTIDL